MIPARAHAALELVSHALIDRIERGADPREVFELLTGLLHCASRIEGVPPQKTPPPVPEVTWTVTRSDALRAAAESVYRAENGRENGAIEARVRELYALVAPYVATGEMQELAWELRHAWGDVATSLVRPLWELAYG